MSKPGALKSARGTSGPTGKTTDSKTTKGATSGTASIGQRPTIERRPKRRPSWVNSGFNTSGTERKSVEGGDVSIRFPNPVTTTPSSGSKIGTQFFAKFDPSHRVGVIDGNNKIRKRAKLKRFETRPTSSRPDESKAKPKRSASTTLRFAAATVGSAIGAAVGKALDKERESPFAKRERESLPAAMAGLSNGEILKIFKHVEHPKSDSDKYLRDVADNHLPRESRRYPIHYLRAFVKGRKFSNEQDICTELMRDLRERTNHGAASDQLAKLFKCNPTFDDLIAEAVAWDASPLKEKVQALLQGAKAGFESRRPPN